MRTIRKLWEQITEPRHMKMLAAVMYAVVLVMGVVALVDPPRSLEGALGGALTAIWAWCLTIGGSAGLSVVFTAWWWVERLALVLIFAAALDLIAVTLLMAVDRTGDRWYLLGLTLVFGLAFVVRWVSIRRYNFEPRTGGVVSCPPN
ncbi:hypothetical protein [Microbacterium sp.]|uniref:hypothetical protein n=1 Tax=Microbacterium sp. TaxID=51671 RepID=UPI002812875C|nr:hypothetical protein [Microbacterium sp.]